MVVGGVTPCFRENKQAKCIMGSSRELGENMEFDRKHTVEKTTNLIYRNLLRCCRKIGHVLDRNESRCFFSRSRLLKRMFITIENSKYFEILKCFFEKVFEHFKNMKILIFL